MKKRLIPRSMKVFMTILLVIGIGCYVVAGVTLYNSDYKISNYYDEIKDMLYFGEFNYNEGNKVTTSIIPLNPEGKTLNISTANSDIEVIGYDGNELKVEMYGKINGSVNTDQLISSKTNGDVTELSLLNETIHNYKSLRVYIPKSYKKDITIYSNTGNIELVDINANTLTVKTEQEEINMRGVTANTVLAEAKYSKVYSEMSNFNNLKVSTTSGDVDLNGFIGESTINTKSGEIDLHLNNVGKLTDVKTESGNIRINMGNGLSYTAEFSSKSGNMKCNNERYSGNSNDIQTYTKGTGENKIKLETKSGNININ